MTDDDTPQSCSECGQTHETPEMAAAREATTDAFFKAIAEQGLDPVEQLLVAVSISASMADTIFQGLAPDVPLDKRSTEQKLEYLVRFVAMVDEDLAQLLMLPIDVSVEDDEEINPAGFMPGLSRVH